MVSRKYLGWSMLVWGSGTLALVSLLAVAGIAVAAVLHHSEQKLEPRRQALLVLKDLRIQLQTAQTAGLGLTHRRIVGELRAAQMEKLDLILQQIDEQDALARNYFWAEPEIRLFEALSSQLTEWRREVGRLLDAARERDRLLATGLTADAPEVAKVELRLFERYLAQRSLALGLESTIDKLAEMDQFLSTGDRWTAEKRFKESLGLLIFVWLGILLVLTLAGVIIFLLAPRDAVPAESDRREIG